MTNRRNSAICQLTGNAQLYWFTPILASTPELRILVQQSADDANAVVGSVEGQAAAEYGPMAKRKVTAEMRRLGGGKEREQALGPA